MRLNCTKKQVIQLIEQYYEKVEGKKVKASILSKRGCVGLYEIEDCITTITIKEEFDVLGVKMESKKNLTKEDLQDKLNILLEEKGYIITQIVYDAGLTSNWEGYGMGEREIKRAYFNGISLEVNEKKDRPITKRRCL